MTSRRPVRFAPRPPRRPGIAACAASCLLLGVAPAAFAQNALGDGRGLENRRVTMGRGNYQRPDFQQELRFRNAIVTGNAPNFLSFRGEIPFTEPDTFRGDLGSNDLFAFRRDSLFSGLAGQGIRGTEALQFQASLTTGTAPPPGLVGPFVVDRAGVGRSARTLLDTPRIERDLRGGRLLDTPPIRRANPLDDPDRGFSTGGMLQGLLRSPTTYTTTRDYRPAYLGVIPDEEQQPRALTATGLLGVRLSPVGGEDDAAAQAQRERAARLADAAEDAETAPGAPRRAGATRIDNRIETAHSLLLNRFATLDTRLGAETDRPSADPDRPGERPAPGDAPDRGGERSIDPWQRDLIELRNFINTPGPASPRDDGTGDARTEEGEAGREDGDDDADRRGFDRLLDEDVVIEQLATAPDTVDDTYLRLVRRAEDQIRAGEYFDAEETFSIALSIAPNDPGAQIGRIHAQLGAGLYLSAAINVRQVFTAFPELAAARFGRRLLPPRERIEEIVATLEGYLEAEPGAARRNNGPGGRLAGSLRREAGLLLAYVGRQTGDRDLVRRGLSDFRAAAEGDPDTDADDATPELRLLRVLEPAWLGSDAAPAGSPTDRGSGSP